MKENLPSIMMGAFLLALILSVWKLYKFLPNKRLPDDDTTEQSLQQLTILMLEVIQSHVTAPTHRELFKAIQTHNKFDTQHFWRFNENKLHQLLQRYYLKNNISSIEEIHKKLKFN
jgi:hypothetical protein